MQQSSSHNVHKQFTLVRDLNYCSWVNWPQHPYESLIIFASCYFRDTYCSRHFNFAIYCPRRDFSQNATILKKMRVNLRTTRSLWLSMDNMTFTSHRLPAMRETCTRNALISSSWPVRQALRQWGQRWHRRELSALHFQHSPLFERL